MYIVISREPMVYREEAAELISFTHGERTVYEGSHACSLHLWQKLQWGESVDGTNNE